MPAAGERILRVDGLEPNQKYVFAVAAYDAKGELVGDAIGATTEPILAYMPLSLLTAWQHLAQVELGTHRMEFLCMGLTLEQ